MNWIRCAFAALAIGLAGCATLSQSDRVALEHHGVPVSLRDRMVHGVPLTLPEIIELSHHELSPRFIIRYLHDTYQVYQLSTDDVLELKRSGVNKEVIDYLLATPRLFGRVYDPWYRPYDDFYYGYPSVVILRGGHYHHH